MTERRLLLLTAASTAALGVIALVSGSGLVAALAGVGAIAVASLAVRDTAGDDAAPSVTSATTSSSVPEETPQTPVATRSSVGMLDEASLEPALRSRTAVARRALRPLSVLYLDVMELDADGRPAGRSELVVEILDATLRESDLCARRSDGVYVFMLEDTGADGAVWTAERLRRRLAAAAGERRFCAGIASYPNHALDAEGLSSKAAAALASAREWNRDRIEVAPET